MEDFISIPNLSPSFDPDWNENGLLEQAAEHLKSWSESQDVKGAKFELIKDDGYTPVLFIEIDASEGYTADKTVLMYGHYDKQPHFPGWKEGLGPTDPVIIDEMLYGRGGADDGYAIYAAILSVKAL